MEQKTFLPLLHWPEFLVIPSLRKKLNVCWPQKNSITNLIEAPEEKVFAKVPELSTSFCSRIGCGECNLSQLASLLSGIIKILDTDFEQITTARSKVPPRYRADVSAIQRPLGSSLVSDDTIFSPLTCRLAAHPHNVDSRVRGDTETHEPAEWWSSPATLSRSSSALLRTLGWRIEVKSWLILLFTLTQPPKWWKIKHVKISRSTFSFIGGIHCKGNEALCDSIFFIRKQKLE